MSTTPFPDPGAPPLIAFHASHEQFPPSVLLRLAVRAEAAGFSALSSSDHFHPWTEAQGQSGFSWAWLGAALQATALPAGVVCAPGQRYHPAIVAQAAATLAEMFPRRVWVALGTGEALNECITGTGWPPKADRTVRLRECVDVMRALFRGETVTHRGSVVVEEARLYTRPADAPPLIGAAVTAETAAWVASWADGLVTVSRPLAELRAVVDAFRRAGGEGKPMLLKVQLSYALSEEDALRGALEQWRVNVLPSPVLSDLRSPSHFEALARGVPEEAVRRLILVSSDLRRHLDALREYAALGFRTLILHNVNREQERFVDAFGEHVLPEWAG